MHKPDFHVKSIHYSWPRLGGELPTRARTTPQAGISLILALSALAVVMLLGASAAQVVLQNEKASRGDRDRQLAFHAAEAALQDAELDITQTAHSVAQRGRAFAAPASAELFIEACGAGKDNPSLGLCRNLADGIPAWQAVDFLDADPVTAKSVPYGRFTGQIFQSAKPAAHAASADAPVPARLPRYIIEALVYNLPGEAADLAGQTYFYRITAMGFGMRDSTQVVLQTLYRKE